VGPHGQHDVETLLPLPYPLPTVEAPPMPISYSSSPFWPSFPILPSSPCWLVSFEAGGGGACLARLLSLTCWAPAQACGATCARPPRDGHVRSAAAAAYGAPPQSHSPFSPLRLLAPAAAAGEAAAVPTVASSTPGAPLFHLFPSFTTSGGRT